MLDTKLDKNVVRPVGCCIIDGSFMCLYLFNSIHLWVLGEELVAEVAAANAIWDRGDADPTEMRGG